MMNKEKKLEWRVAAYMALWTAIVTLIKWGATSHGMSNEAVVGFSAAGVICMVYAVILSFIEKHGDTPFLWIKRTPTNQHWAMPGLLGVFTNASSIAAIGIGCMAKNFIQLIGLYVLMSALMMLQRRFLNQTLENKAKRVSVGLILPTVVIAVVSIGSFYNNALVSLEKSIEETEEKQNLSGAVALTKENWQEYFTIETKEELEYNDDDELKKVKYVSVINLKEEYQDKVVYSEEKKSELFLNGYLHTEIMVYEITDAKNSEWETVRESLGMKQVGPSDSFSQYWWMDGADDFVKEHAFDSGSNGGKLYVEIPEEFEIKAVTGKIYFE